MSTLSYEPRTQDELKAMIGEADEVWKRLTETWERVDWRLRTCRDLFDFRHLYTAVGRKRKSYNPKYQVIERERESSWINEDQQTCAQRTRMAASFERMAADKLNSLSSFLRWPICEAFARINVSEFESVLTDKGAMFRFLKLMAAKLHDMDSVEEGETEWSLVIEWCKKSQPLCTLELEGPFPSIEQVQIFQGAFLNLEELQEAFSVFDRDKSPGILTNHRSDGRKHGALCNSPGGRVTASELKHVMNSLGEKAQTRFVTNFWWHDKIIQFLMTWKVTNEEVEQMIAEAQKIKHNTQMDEMDMWVKSLWSFLLHMLKNWQLEIVQPWSDFLHVKSLNPIQWM